MTEDELYDFCLDWQMGFTSKEGLVSLFVTSDISFESFKKRAAARHWFVASMNVLSTFKPFI